MPHKVPLLNTDGLLEQRGSIMLKKMVTRPLS